MAYAPQITNKGSRGQDARYAHGSSTDVECVSPYGPF